MVGEEGGEEDNLQRLNLYYVIRSVKVGLERDKTSQKEKARSRQFLTFLHKLGPCEPLLDLFFVGEVRVAHKGSMQPRPEVVVALGVVPAKK